MSDRLISALGAVAVLMVAATIGTYFHQAKKVSDTFEKGVLFQGLDVDRIATIDVEKGGKTFSLQRHEGYFVISWRGNFPVKTDSVNRLVEAVVNLRVDSLLTSDPARYAELGVADAKSGESYRIAMGDNSGQSILELWVGKSHDSGGLYVRRGGKDSVYITDGSLWLDTDYIDYIDTSLASLLQTDIEMVSVNGPGSEVHLIRGGEKNEPVLQGLADEQEPKDADCKAVFNAIASLSIDDFHASDDPTVQGLDFDFTYKAFLARSEYQVQSALRDGVYYVRARARWNGEDPQIIRENDSAQVKQEKEKTISAWEAVQKFNDRCMNSDGRQWIFTVSEWKGKNFRKTLGELAQSKPKKFLANMDAERIDKIQIRTAGGDFTLRREGELLYNDGAKGYPLTAGKAAEFLLMLRDLRVQDKTLEPNWAEYELEYPLAQGAATAQITLFDADGNTLADFLVGTLAGVQGGNYVRNLADDGIGETAKPLSALLLMPQLYVERRILQLVWNEVASVEVATSEAQYVLEAIAENTALMQDQPADKKLNMQAAVEIIKAGLDLYSMDHFPHDDAYVADMQFLTSHQIVLKNGVVYKLMLADKEGRSFARVTVDASNANKDELKAVAEAFNKRHGSWVYEISPEVAADLVMPLQLLLAD